MQNIINVSKLSESINKTEHKYSNYLDQLIEFAENQGVNISEKKQAVLLHGLTSYKVSTSGIENFVKDTIERHKDRGLHWDDKKEPTKTGVVSVLRDINGEKKAFIIDQKEKGYCAIRFDDGKTRAPKATFKDIESMKRVVNTLETSKTISSTLKEKEIGHIPQIKEMEI